MFFYRIFAPVILTDSMTDKFDEIRHFNLREAILVRREIFADETFIHALEKLDLGVTVDDLKEECKTYESHYAFQKAVPGRFLTYVNHLTTSKITYSGLENIDQSKAYLYIANHRDIIMDSAYLQYYFFENNVNTSKIAIGDNLVTTPLLLNIAKLNKMFIVKRGGGIREKLLNSKLLSEYIHYSMFEEKESVWIAQRNGRTKDGLDKTQQGLIKMLTFYDESRDVIEILKEMHITPLTVSYEYEPCDKLKARELALSENGKYVKKPGEDFNSVKQGIFGWKGEVNFVIGKPIDEQLDTISPELRKNDKLNEVAKIIDQQIYQNYHLFATNYIAYDYLEHCQEFAEYYTPKQKEEFLQYIDKQSIVEDVAADKMKSYLLQIYANPVKTHYGKELNHKEDNDW